LALIGLMKNLPYDQRIARILVRPLVNSPVTPNHLTTLTLILALAGAGLMTTADAQLLNWGAGLFALARFLDHFDGELARQKNLKSRLGYFYDYVAGTLSYGALFFCTGVGLNHRGLELWALLLGTAGAITAILSMWINLDIDKIQGGDETIEGVGYPGFAGFELEDGIYLIAPVTWAGFLPHFFITAGIVPIIYLGWTFWTLLVLKRVIAKKLKPRNSQNKLFQGSPAF
jgi:archaetidylinositol phosphate synthase